MTMKGQGNDNVVKLQWWICVAVDWAVGFLGLCQVTTNPPPTCMPKTYRGIEFLSRARLSPEAYITYFLHYQVQLWGELYHPLSRIRQRHKICSTTHQQVQYTTTLNSRKRESRLKMRKVASTILFVLLCL